jgi:hypothetical protein
MFGSAKDLGSTSDFEIGRARYGKPANAVVRGRSSRADQARTAADRQV